MNRRQVLFGASATAAVFGGFVPSWANAQGSSSMPVAMSVTFAPFTDGIRGTYTLNGQVTLVGTIPPVPGRSSAAVAAPALEGAIVQQASAAPEPAPAAAPVQSQYTAPARPPMMSIVSVPRGSAARPARIPH